MKHVLYTVANSNIMRGLGNSTTIVTKTAYWRIVLIALDAIVLAALVGWGIAVFVRARRKMKG